MQPSNVRIDEKRYWDTLMQSAKIGPGSQGGMSRLALSASDKEMRDLFVRWCKSAGCAVSIDKMGSIFARRSGSDDSLPPVLVGSHLDTQIHGGPFDGCADVLAGLELLRTLNDHGIQTKRPIEIVDWSNEEGARFAPAMMASAVFAGVTPLSWAHGRTDKDGIAFGDALKSIGYDGKSPMGGRQLDSYFELHIEQGPQLEEKGIPVGVVVGSFAIQGMNIRIRGENAHVGPTPMDRRKNALVGAAHLIVAVNEIGWGEHNERGKASSARIEVEPNLFGILPHYAQVTCDFRHPTVEGVERMVRALEGRLPEIRQRSNCQVEIVERWQYGSEAFSRECIDLVRDTAKALGFASMDMLSEAGHDAFHITHVAPVAMIFTPCEKGISHSEKEWSKLEDLAPAANVLLHAVLARANA
jgi:beta-ureidopropionase / N-carbamoyl-L-amino-acid hydrolase